MQNRSGEVGLGYFADMRPNDHRSMRLRSKRALSELAYGKSQIRFLLGIGAELTVALAGINHASLEEQDQLRPRLLAAAARQER